MEVKLVNKLLYKLELYLVKIIPMIISGLYLLNTILSYTLDIHLEIMSAIGGVSLLTWLFLYVSSYVFKFCEYHRMFLYYIASTEIICWYDYKIGINANDKTYFFIQLIIAGIFMFLIIYFKFYARRTKEANSKVS